ncbi:MAG: hypothetical protein R3F43_09245 [bacterium]
MGGIAILATAPDTVVTVRPGSTRLAADPGGQVVVPDAEGLIQLTLQPHEVLTLNGRNGPYPVTERDLGRGGRVVGAAGRSSPATSARVSPACWGPGGSPEEEALPHRRLGPSVRADAPGHPRPAGVREPSEVNYWRLVADRETRITLEPPLRRPGRPWAGLCGQQRLRGGAHRARRAEPGSRAVVRGRDAAPKLAFEATEPIMVAGMLSGQDSTGWDTPYQSRAGDPSLFLLVPIGSTAPTTRP